MSMKNYNQAYRNARSEVNAVEEAIPTDVVDEVTETIDVLTALEGTVCNCDRLNIRNKPDKESDVLTIVDKSSKLTIFIDESNEDWYSVETEDGVEGFCMRKYVLLTEN